MTDPILIDQLATEVWQLYTSDTANAETNIERYLKKRFSHLSNDEKLKTLERLASEFEGVSEEKTVAIELDDDLVDQIASLLLGDQVNKYALSSGELAHRISESLNTLFDALNHLIGVINKTLWGNAHDDKTIRQVIGSQLSGSDSSTSLEAHINQIGNAFLTVQRAFKETVRSQVARMLDEMDPDNVSGECAGGVKLGVFRRAACYAVYQEKFGRIKRWFDSDKFMEDFLREFEKKCQALAEK